MHFYINYAILITPNAQNVLHETSQVQPAVPSHNQLELVQIDFFSDGNNLFMTFFNIKRDPEVLLVRSSNTCIRLTVSSTFK